MLKQPLTPLTSGELFKDISAAVFDSKEETA